MNVEEVKSVFEPEKPDVPDDWSVSPFSEVVEVVSDKGKRTKQREYLEEGRIPVIDQGQDFIGGYIDNEEMAFDGDLPIIVFGDHTRAIKYVTQRFAVGADGVKLLKPTECYDPKFFFYLLKSLQIPSRGYSRHFQFLKKFHLPVAPLEQQKRIVAEIEKQFSRLDEAVANLKRVKATLKCYKAAVLKAAVEGKLTEEWRRRGAIHRAQSMVQCDNLGELNQGVINHAPTEPIETGAELLQRILAERREKWQGRGKYKEPVAPDTSGLPKLPVGWVWTRLDTIAALKGGITVDKKRKDSTARLVPYLRVANVQRGYIDLSEVKKIAAPATDIEDLRLHSGDILFNEGGDRDKLGRGWIWEGQITDCIHQNHVFRARP